MLNLTRFVVYFVRKFAGNRGWRDTMYTFTVKVADP